MIIISCFLFLLNIVLAFLLSDALVNLEHEKTKIALIYRLDMLVKKAESRVRSKDRLCSIAIRLIDNSGLTIAIPEFKVIYLWMACLLSGFAIFLVIVLTGLSFVSAVILGLIGAGIPLMLLDILSRYNADRVREKLSDFISILSRWCGVREDILYALEKSVDSGIGEPINTYIKETCLRVKGGMPIDDALVLLGNRVDNTLFKDLVINIRQTVKSRGDIKGLLQRMETQYYRIKAEFDRRNIKTFKDRLLVYIMMAFVPLAASWFLTANRTMSIFYLENSTGRLIFTILTIVYAFGVWFSLKLTSKGV